MLYFRYVRPDSNSSELVTLYFAVKVLAHFGVCGGLDTSFVKAAGREKVGRLA